MNTIGRFFENKEKRYPAAPDWSGKITITEPFLKSLGDAYRAWVAAGRPEPFEMVIEGRWKRNENLSWLNLTVIPPKVQP